MKVYTRRWRTLPCLWFCKINIVKIVILPKEIYRFKARPIKIPMQSFIHMVISKFIWKHREVKRS